MDSIKTKPLPLSNHYVNTTVKNLKGEILFEGRLHQVPSKGDVIVTKSFAFVVTGVTWFLSNNEALLTVE